jgi:hypothetical protein
MNSITDVLSPAKRIANSFLFEMINAGTRMQSASGGIKQGGSKNGEPVFAEASPRQARRIQRSFRGPKPIFELKKRRCT